MKFNDNVSSGSNQGLVQDARFLLDLQINDTGSYPTEDLTRNINSWYRRVNSWIWHSTRLWEYDDNNYTTLPIATTDLVAGQQDYEMPSSAQRIIRVEVLDNDGDWVLLDQIDQSQVNEAMSEFYKTDGMPLYYDLIGRSLLLYPAPAAADVTLTAGLKLYFARDISEFIITSTNTEPGFVDNFHRILSLGGALDWAISKGITNKVSMLQPQIEGLRAELEQFYGRRNLDKKLRINPSTEGIIGQY